MHGVDGQVFVGFMCSWGPAVLSRHHPVVEAAQRQAAQGDGMNGPAPMLVGLAELLAALVPYADWCQFGKNGTDATTACITVAWANNGQWMSRPARPMERGRASTRTGHSLPETGG